VKVANGTASWWDLGLAAVDTGLAVLGARGAGDALAKGAESYAEQGVKATLKESFATARKEAAEKVASRMRSYKNVMRQMKNPSVEGLAKSVVGFSKNAGAIKRITNYDDARKATGLIRSAYAIDKAEVPVYLLKKGKDVLGFGRDVDQGGWSYATHNAIYNNKKSMVKNLDPKGYTNKLPQELQDEALGKPDMPTTLQLPGHHQITIPTKVTS